MLDELRAPSRGDPSRMPFGVRFTVKFLSVVAALLLMPLLGFGFLCLVWVWSAARHAEEGFGVCVASALCLACFLAVMAVFLGALWMSTLLRSRYPADYPTIWPPDHPVTSIAKPLLIVIQVQVVLAIVAWVLGVATGEDASLIWPGFWAGLGAICGIALHLVKRHWKF